MPQEIEVWYIIPAIRRELTLAMKNNGIKQTDIAKKLGITKSAVNQYIHLKRGKDLDFSQLMKNEVNKSAFKINSPLDAVREIQYLINLSKKENITCQVHRLINKSLPDKCDVCFNISVN